MARKMKTPDKTMEEVWKNNEEWTATAAGLRDRGLCVACGALGSEKPAGGCGDARHPGDTQTEIEHQPGVEAPADAVPAARWTDTDLDTLKELSRKLAWSVTSTLGLKGEAKGKMLGWAEGMSRKILAQYNGLDRQSH